MSVDAADEGFVGFGRPGYGMRLIAAGKLTREGAARIEEGHADDLGLEAASPMPPCVLA